jgi:hypothetical protein
MRDRAEELSSSGCFDAAGNGEASPVGVNPVTVVPKSLQFGGVLRSELTAETNALVEVARFEDYCGPLNGPTMAL